jgi:hypothetical protein
MKKSERVSFSVDSQTRQMWEKTSSSVIYKKVFRNKAEIFESLILFLSQAPEKELWDFRKRIVGFQKKNYEELMNEKI